MFTQRAAILGCSQHTCLHTCKAAFKQPRFPPTACRMKPASRMQPALAARQASTLPVCSASAQGLTDVATASDAWKAANSRLPRLASCLQQHDMAQSSMVRDAEARSSSLQLFRAVSTSQHCNLGFMLCESAAVQQEIAHSAANLDPVSNSMAPEQ